MLITSCELAAGDVVTVSLNVILFHITQMPLPPPPLPLQVFFAIMLGKNSIRNAISELRTFGAAIGAGFAVFEVIDQVC